ncbi:MAG: DUF2795 domain-containing protein [Streptosporangiaceae bacterium]
MTAADRRRVRKALDGLGYPASKGEITTYAEDRGADAKTREALRALPDSVYHNGDDVERAVPQSPAGE